MYVNKTGRRFQPKSSFITLKQLLSREQTTIGRIELDLSNFCSLQPKEEILIRKLKRCTDKNSKFKSIIRSKWLQSITSDENDDTVSQLSCADSVDTQSQSDWMRNFDSDDDHDHDREHEREREQLQIISSG